MDKRHSIFQNIEYEQHAKELLAEQAILDKRKRACASSLYSSCRETDLITVLKVVVDEGHTYTKANAQSLLEKISLGNRLELEELYRINELYRQNISCFRK